MTEQERCALLDRQLTEEWEPFSAMGDGESFQAYLTTGDYGVIGRPGHWQIVHAADGQPAASVRPGSLSEALMGALILSLRSTLPAGGTRDPEARDAAGETVAD